MPFFARYDWVGVAIFLVIWLGGWAATGSWHAFLILGTAVGNLAAWVLRRRAGIPDRSLIGLWRSARAARRRS